MLCFVGSESLEHQLLHQTGMTEAHHVDVGLSRLGSFGKPIDIEAVNSRPERLKPSGDPDRR